MESTVWLWIIYLVVVIVIWIILSASFSIGMGLWMGLLCASIVGLVVGLMLIGFYKRPCMDANDELSLSIFIWVSALLPLVALIIVVLSAEYKRFWADGNGSCKVQVEIECNNDICQVVHYRKTCNDNEVTIHNHMTDE